MSKSLRRALISVSDKRGIVDFAHELIRMDVMILSTGGTAHMLRENGIQVTTVSEYTGFPEILDGRVKTLHPGIHGGILAQRDNPEHMDTLQRLGFETIDMVVVNLHPFKETSSSRDTVEQVLEDIDIGGLTLVRSAAKNYRGVVTIVNPDRYQAVVLEMKENGGQVNEATRFALAIEAFRHTGRYDMAVYRCLSARPGEDPFHAAWTLHLDMEKEIPAARPRGQAALYSLLGEKGINLAGAELIYGDEPGDVQLLHLDTLFAVLEKAEDTSAVALAGVSGLAGAARAMTQADAWRNACKPAKNEKNIITAFNSPVEPETALEMARRDLPIALVAAPDFTLEALNILKKTPDWPDPVQLLRTGVITASQGTQLSGLDLHRIAGGFIARKKVSCSIENDNINVFTDRRPTGMELKDLRLAWTVAVHMSSAAAVLVRDLAVLACVSSRENCINAATDVLRRAPSGKNGMVLALDHAPVAPDFLGPASDAGVTALIFPEPKHPAADLVAEANRLDMALVCRI